jgi:hypothetical protein
MREEEREGGNGDRLEREWNLVKLCGATRKISQLLL